MPLTAQVHRAARRTLFASVVAAACCVLAAHAEERERCYPGSPLRILRELLGGSYTPERYKAAILDFARANCANGQTLKLVSPAGPGPEDELNEQVALALCDRETVYRDRLARGEKALVVFCLISKLDPPPQ